jgi:hypothetical protein
MPVDGMVFDESGVYIPRASDTMKRQKVPIQGGIETMGQGNVLGEKRIHGRIRRGKTTSFREVREKARGSLSP